MRYIIEYRNGSFFERLGETCGVSRDKAKKFNSKKEAETFMYNHWVILLNGGMVVPAGG